VAARRPLRLVLFGATGAVGAAVLEVLEERDDFPVASVRALDSGRSSGGEASFRGDGLRVETVKAGAFRGCDLALLAVPAEVARIWAPAARAEGCLVVDASTAFRGDEEVPLVVAEVNPGALAALPRGIAAAAAGLVPALARCLGPLAGAAGLAQVGVVALESASGAGRPGIAQLEAESLALMKGQEPSPPAAFPHRLAFNLVPDVGRPHAGTGTGTDAGAADGQAGAGPAAAEPEARLCADLLRVLGGGVAAAATAIRVPVFYGHAAALSLSTLRPLSADAARELLRQAPGVKVVDLPAERLYPMPMLGVNDDAALVGRLREDPSRQNGLQLFVTVDNLRGGGAACLVEVARRVAEQHLWRD
jgi:aspartate-semialdehyde dehydrogenase